MINKKIRLSFLFLMLALTFTVKSQQIESIKGYLSPAVKGGGFSMGDYILWCPTVIKVDGTYHMFASRWPVKYGLGGWTKYSECVRATSKNLYGPYEFQEVVLRKRPDAWDNSRVHNVKIVKTKDKFVLYYINSANQIGYAEADKITGPWTRVDEPILRFSNPAPLVREDGGVYIFGRMRDAEDKNRGLAAVASSYKGPYSLIEEGKNLLPNDYELEDPTIWWANNQYNIICNDWKAKATGVTKGGVQYYSKDGVTYHLVSHEPIFNRNEPVVYDDGSVEKFARIERPFVFTNEKNEVIALFTANLYPDSLGGRAKIVVHPVKQYYPKKSVTKVQRDKLQGLNDAVVTFAENNGNSAFCSFLPEKYIYKETPDSVIFIAGLTKAFTVDTPENEGLSPTTFRVEELAKAVNKNTGVYYRVLNSLDQKKAKGNFESGDYIEITNTKTGKKQTRKVGLQRAALKGTLLLDIPRMTVGSRNDIILSFFAGQRSPMAEVIVDIPPGVRITPDNTFINVIGRGEVSLKDLPKQSIGRTGTNYSYHRVGNVAIKENGTLGQQLILSNLDLRPANGADLIIRIQNPGIHKKGQFLFSSRYKTSAPESYTSPGGGMENATLTIVSEISDFSRMMPRQKKYERPELTTADFSWTPAKGASRINLFQSADKGKTWQLAHVAIDPGSNKATIRDLVPNRLYAFRLDVEEGPNRGKSNIAWHYSGMLDVKNMGAAGDGKNDDTEKINEALAFMNRIGGGIVLFSKGQYNVRTVYLQSNVWLYIDKDATIQAIEGSDEPEATWFSDRAYRSGLSPTDPKPYQDPENYLTKQDVGHTFFRNAMFFAERADNIKIIGNGYITGNGILATSDRVMESTPGRRADKMFSFKLCTNIEIGGLDNGKDLWYDPQKDLPYYIGGNGHDDSNMLQIDRGGHFVLLATGTDHIYVHNTCFAKQNSGSARDIYDFMACNHVTVTNIYSKVSSDDIVKLGSDCALGFTRPVKNYTVRNIIGDTNCNLFQIGSETADDIQDVYVDNIYVLGSNKAGFSISTNDGGHIKNIHLNSGHTGSIHSRSVMHRTRVPFFISISNRARVIGADVARFSFDEHGTTRNELLATNVNIGKVENVTISGVDISEVYGGSSYRGDRWKAFDGSQNEATAIIAGYKLPDDADVEGGLTFRLPNGQHTGYIENIRFSDVNMAVKGGHATADAALIPPELGVGRYNVSDFKIQPSFGFWIRHVKGLTMKDCVIRTEETDGRSAIVLDDVHKADIVGLKVTNKGVNGEAIKAVHSSAINF